MKKQRRSGYEILGNDAVKVFADFKDLYPETINIFDLAELDEALTGAVIMGVELKRKWIYIYTKKEDEVLIFAVSSKGYHGIPIDLNFGIINNSLNKLKSTKYVVYTRRTE